MDMEQFPVTPVDPVRKKRSKKSIILLIAGIVLLVAAVSAAGFFAFRYYAVSSHITQLNADKVKLNSDIAKLKQDSIANASSEQLSAQSPKSAANLTQVLLSMEQHPVDLTSDDESTIMEVVKRHYDVDTLPEGAAIILSYQMVKSGDAPSDAKRALVYWPKTSSKPAEFVDVVQDAGSDAWRFEDSY